MSEDVYSRLTEVAETMERLVVDGDAKVNVLRTELQRAATQLDADKAGLKSLKNYLATLDDIAVGKF